MALDVEDEFLDAFAEDEISEIWIVFPDPQIKFNRRRKRLTSSAMLDKYNSLLKKEGIVHLKTDSLFLHGYTLGILESRLCTIIKSLHDIYGTFHNDPSLEIKTHYENMFLKQQQPITYLSFSFID